MKKLLFASAAVIALGLANTPPSQAAGCIKGAIVGGIAGHYAGGHSVVGAGAGCAIGHHEATKTEREQAAHDQADQNRHAGDSNQPTHQYP